MSSPVTCAARFDQLAASFHARYNLTSNTTQPPTPTSASTWPPTIFPVSSDPNVTSIQIREGCGPMASYESFSMEGSSEEIVVDIIKFDGVGDGGLSTAQVVISNCNGSENFNTTTASAFIMRSSEFLVALEREPQSQTPPFCLGSKRVEYIAKPLSEYCLSYSGLPECEALKKSNASASKAPASVPTANSSAAVGKRSAMATLVSIFVAAASLTCV